MHLADSTGVDFTRYDNWNNTNASYGSDGYVDFIIFQYRRVPGNGEWFYYRVGAGGSTDPISYDSLFQIDGKRIYKGIWTIANLGNTTQTEVLNEHEFFHYIYNFSHTGFNGGHVSMGMLTEGTSNSTYCLTPMERSASDLNWTTPTIVDSNHLKSNYILRDFIAIGDELKVKIPNTNPAEYFWISNHQKISKYDGVSRGSYECWQTNKYKQDPYCGEGKGLFIFHESSDGCANNIYGYSSGSRHYPFDLINSEGRFKWDSLRRVTDANLGSIKLMTEITGSRDSGVSEYNKYQLTPSSWSAQLITDDFCSSASNDYFISGDFHGDGLDAYNTGYDEIFSPYSNPTTRSCQNLSNNGLTIVLQSQDISGAINLKIYYDDSQALIDLPPSKPKNLRVVKDFFGADTGVFGGGDPGTFHPKITWDKNIEPDFNTTSYLSNPEEVEPKYHLYRGYNTDCESEPTYSFLAAVNHNDSIYIDNSLTLYDPEHATIQYCTGDLLTYSYKILAKDKRGSESVKSERGLVSGYSTECGGGDEDNRQVSNNENQSDIPVVFSLKQNYPNPFNPTTNIQYDLPSDNFVSIKIFDITGREITTLVNEFKTAGRYSVGFNGTNLSSGIYYYKIEAGNFSQVRKMLLIK